MLYHLFGLLLLTLLFLFWFDFLKVYVLHLNLKTRTDWPILAVHCLHYAASTEIFICSKSHKLLEWSRMNSSHIYWLQDLKTWCLYLYMFLCARYWFTIWGCFSLMLSVCAVYGRITRCRHQTACGRRVKSTAALQTTALTPRNAKWKRKTAWADMWVFAICSLKASAFQFRAFLEDVILQDRGPTFAKLTRRGQQMYNSFKLFFSHYVVITVVVLLFIKILHSS